MDGAAVPGSDVDEPVVLGSVDEPAVLGSDVDEPVVPEYDIAGAGILWILVRSVVPAVYKSGHDISMDRPVEPV